MGCSAAWWSTCSCTAPCRNERMRLSYRMSISAVVMNERSAHTTEEKLHMPATTTVGVRYMIDDVADAIAFYTTHLGFAVEQDATPAFATVTRDGVRLLLSGPTSSGRRPMPTVPDRPRRPRHRAVTRIGPPASPCS